MPRQARIDAPGAVHHVIVRGIERCDIFRDNQDRHDWIERLKTDIRKALRKYFYSIIRRRPVIFPILIELQGA